MRAGEDGENDDLPIAVVVEGRGDVGYHEAVEGEQHEGGGDPVVAPRPAGPQHTANG